MKFGICSEIFNEWKDVERAIHYVKQAGYDGLEVAPFTLAPRVTEISASVRGNIVKWAGTAGLEILGIHWVLVGPNDVYINHVDREVRERTIQYLIDLVRFCGDIGGTRMIFGSPKQRNVMPGLTYEQAFDYTAEAFERVMPACEEHGVTICMEPLSPKETNFCASSNQVDIC